MASYAYVIIDKMGKERKGSMEAANEALVWATLKAEGHIPMSVGEQGALNKDINFNIGNPIKSRDLSVFCRQMVSILAAGVTVISALNMLGDQTENKVLKKTIKEVQLSVEKGETLAGAMKLQKKIFPPILLHMVEAGESSGSLEIAFDRMSSHFEKEARLKATMQKAMVYPTAVAIIAVAVITLMMLMVIPNFVGMFEQMNIELPVATKIVVSISKFMVAKWWLIMIIIIIAVVGIGMIKGTPQGQIFFGHMALKVPLLGVLTIKSSSSRLARTLSTLLAAGIPMIEAIDITAKTMDNVIVKECLMKAKEDVARGVALSVPLEASGIFPPMVYHMTKIGEETGNIEGMLNKVADYFDEEVEVATESLIAAMEPLIVVVLAVVVGGIILAIMSPMMSMYSGIENM